MTITLGIKKGTPKTMSADDNPTFERYVERIDALLYIKVGLRLADLPDVPVRDWFDDRLRVVWAAQKALKIAQS